MRKSRFSDRIADSIRKAERKHREANRQIPQPSSKKTANGVPKSAVASARRDQIPQRFYKRGSAKVAAAAFVALAAGGAAFVATNSTAPITKNPSTVTSGPEVIYFSGFTLKNNSANLSSEVNAVSQPIQKSGVVASLLNGVTNDGYWYQIGVTYEKHILLTNGKFLTGFGLTGSVISPDKTVIYPKHSDSQVSLDKVDAGDKIKLSLSIRDGEIMATATDVSRKSEKPYYIMGHDPEATTFVGTNLSANSNGFSTGDFVEIHQHDAAPTLKNAVRFNISGNGFEPGSMWQEKDTYTSEQAAKKAIGGTVRDGPIYIEYAVPNAVISFSKRELNLSYRSSNSSNTFTVSGASEG